MLKLDKNGYPRLSKDRVDLAVRVVPTESGNPFHDPFSGKFTYAPPGVTILEGDPEIQNLSKATRQTLFDRSNLVRANQAVARVINGNLHIVLLRDGRKLDSFAVPPKEIQKQLANPEEKDGELGKPLEEESDTTSKSTTLEITGEIRDAIMDAARNLDLSAGELIAYVEEKAGVKFNARQRQELLALVNDQRINDLIDYLHQNLRRQELNTKDTDKVRILTPRGYLRKSISRLTEEDLQEVLTRLQARGWQESVIQERVIAGFPKRFKDKFHVESKERNPDK